MAGLQYIKTGTDQKEHVLLFVYSKAVVSKLETGRTVILPLTVSVLCTHPRTRSNEA